MRDLTKRSLWASEASCSRSRLSRLGAWTASWICNSATASLVDRASEALDIVRAGLVTLIRLSRSSSYDSILSFTFFRGEGCGPLPHPSGASPRAPPPSQGGGAGSGLRPSPPDWPSDGALL